MNKKMIINWLKKNYLHFAMIFILLLVASIYFYPAFSGKTIEQADVTNWIGSSKEIQDHRKLYDEEPMWSNNSFIGMSAENVSMSYKGNLVSKIQQIITLGLPEPIDILFMYFLSFYLMMICFKVKPWIALIGALAFGFSSYFIIILEAGHVTKSWAISFMPMIIGGAYLVFNRNFWLGLGVSALFMSFELSSNHPQITYYLGIIIGFLFVVELVKSIVDTIKNKNSKSIIKYIVSTFSIILVYFLALGVNYGKISAVRNGLKHTTRGESKLTINSNLTEKKTVEKGLDFEYITQWSNGIDETFSLIFPYAKGYGTSALSQEKYKDIVKQARKKRETRIVAQNASSVNMYWGNQPFTSGPIYYGIIMFFLAILAVFYIKNPLKWAFVSAIVLTIMLSWGKNFVGLQDYIFIQSAIVLFAISEYIKNKYLKYTGNTLGMFFLIILFVSFRNSDVGLTDFFIENVPLYNKFRAVTMILVVGATCIPLLGTLFLKELSENKDKIKSNLIPFYCVSGISILFIFFILASPSTFVSFLSDQEISMAELGKIPNQFLEALEIFRIDVFKSNVQRSFLFLILTIAVLSIVIWSKKIKSMYAILILAILVLFELVPIDKTFLNNKENETLLKLNQWTGVNDKYYPLSPNKLDLEILENETNTNEKLSKIVLESSEKAKKELENYNFGAIIKRPKGKRKLRKSDTILNFSDNYVLSEKFTALNQNTHYRVLDLTSNFNSSSRASYFHKSFGGYHGAKPRLYQEMVDFHMSKRINEDILDMTNVKYILNRPTKEKPEGFLSLRNTALGNAWLVKKIRFVESENDEIIQLQTVYELEDLSGTNSLTINNKKTNKGLAYSGFYVTLGDETKDDKTPFQVPFDRMIISPNKSSVVLGSDSSVADIVLPPAYFNKYTLKKLAPKHLKISKLNEFNPKIEAIVNNKFKKNIQKTNYSAKGTIKLDSYKANEMVYKFNSTENEFAVFSEMYHPNWKATIDGKEVSINKVDYLLRGIEIPKGEHEIIFSYTIPSLKNSYWISLLFSILIILIFIYGVYYTFKRKECVI